MSSSGFDPRRLDVSAFARQGGELDGDWPLTELARVAESAAPDAPPALGDRAVWSTKGESRPVRGGEPQTWLHLRVAAPVSLVCQRCLAPVAVALTVDRRFRFVAGDAQAAALDEASEDDVLPLEAAFDVRELVEDELLLAMPLMPRHEVCPVPLVAPEDPVEDAAAAHPFAALASLRRDAKLN